MQDRLKFRLFVTENDSYPDKVGYINPELFCIHPDGEESFFSADYDFAECIVEQCTGLKDKNGKLIYEGDIILVDDDKCPVEWDSDNARYNVVGYGEIAYLNYNDIELIGNIHENKELLDD